MPKLMLKSQSRIRSTLIFVFALACASMVWQERSVFAGAPLPDSAHTIMPGVLTSGVRPIHLTAPKIEDLVSTWRLVYTDTDGTEKLNTCEFLRSELRGDVVKVWLYYGFCHLPKPKSKPWATWKKIESGRIIGSDDYPGHETPYKVWPIKDDLTEFQDYGTCQGRDCVFKYRRVGP